eukprot:SAG22_NODE_20_length_32168_cov_40.859241_17_plen_71_part_00
MAAAAAEAIEPAEYTLEEVAEHDNRASCWVVISSMVFDVTNFLAEHPGGYGAPRSATRGFKHRGADNKDP